MQTYQIRPSIGNWLPVYQSEMPNGTGLGKVTQNAAICFWDSKNCQNYFNRGFR